MKRIFFVLVLLIIGISTAFSQQNVKETVYLKNGSVIKGIVIEQIPNKFLKVQTADGSIFVYQMDEVEKITKEIIPAGRRTTSMVRENTITTKKAKSDIRGYRGFGDVGLIVGMGDYGSSGIEMNTSHGFQFNEHFYLGGGMGIHYHELYDAGTIPVFVEGRVNMIKGKFAPFASIRTGISLVTDDEEAGGFYFAPSIGARLSVMRNLAFYLSAGYNLQMTEIYFYTGSSYWYDTKNIGGLSFKFGVEF